MSLAIRHPFMNWPIFPAAAPARTAKPVEAEPPRRGRPGSSLFHRLAAADLAARDLAFPLFLNPSRR